jgi:hypothetical protein
MKGTGRRGMGKKQERPKMKVKKITLTLPVRLTDDERMRTGTLLAEKYIERDAVDERRREKMSAFKAELDGIDKEVGQLSRLLHSGTKEEPVACEVQYDFDAGTVTTYRLDTGEVESTDDMTDADRQQDFDE